MIEMYMAQAEPVSAKCDEREGKLLPDRTMMEARWKQHSGDLLNCKKKGVHKNMINIVDAD